MPKHHKYNHPLKEYVRVDYTALNQDLTIEEALEKIRTEGIGERIVYFYVVDEEQRLVGVLPTRRLLTASKNTIIKDIMITRVAALPDNSTVYDACEFFVTYKFLALPVVDKDHKIIGIVDVNLFTEELLEIEPDIEERHRMSDIFETIGFTIEEIKNATPLKAWRYRFPWLVTTIISGTVCAMLAGLFEATLAESIVIAFFITLVLGLGESISIQSMTVAIQALHTNRPTKEWYIKSIVKELKTAFLLGISCALLVFIVIAAWKNDYAAAFVVSLSIIMVEMLAAFWGISVPTILHRTKLDPKISAGPVTLALTDIGTILFYLGSATLILE
ncbi:CBS domain containing protein [Melioribacter roseus P3M-2]|uniref:CBS domain containing protein n=1 Tax=Melioribacter roseus (strain DSM 23840 / JCM 17771 / VKM B-2668 / P3M-2) TaxID=1191523 RepID=I6Z551_MELRP|nr:magnesium transporter [Melioribacter roseus]AFN74280.1 CBS domain containing protein [Melioribacter roseus P3M-2]